MNEDDRDDMTPTIDHGDVQVKSLNKFRQAGSGIYSKQCSTLIAQIDICRQMRDYIFSSTCSLVGRNLVKLVGAEVNGK
jgi:hypothetical protein